MIIGIIGVIASFIPCVGMFSLIPVIVGFILGIVDTVMKGKHHLPRGMSIAGVVLNAIALLIIIVQVFVISASAAAAADQMHSAAAAADQLQ